MSNTTKSLRNFIFGLFIFSGFIFFTSCNNQAEQQLLTLTNLVPKDSVDQIAYIQQAIKTYKALQSSIDNPNRIGRPISRTFSDQITSFYDEKCSNTRAVFFSFTNIYESLLNIDPNEWSTSGLAVVFGKYPTIAQGATIPAEFSDAGISPQLYYTNYSGRNTVVLKYVKGLTSNLGAATFHEASIGGTVSQIIDDIGMPCPANCPTGTFNNQ